jgi:hypothetical protein
MILEQREKIDRIISAAKKKVWVTFQKEGIHCFPAAATDPKLNTGDEYDVSFLASPHRHIFHFRVCIDVFHDDRELEFIQFKRWLESLYASDRNVLELNYKSCEMIADELYLQIAEKYPDRDVWIEVSEDGENGCYVEYNHTRPYQTVSV